MDLLQLLHDRLLAALPSPTDPSRGSSLTVGDIYQRLIPYRAVRNAAGVMELAEYEHALLRLLAGEGQHLELDDPAATVELQRELASLNPILGIYRDYSRVTVRVRGGSGSSNPTSRGSVDRLGEDDETPVLDSAVAGSPQPSKEPPVSGGSLEPADRSPRSGRAPSLAAPAGPPPPPPASEPQASAHEETISRTPRGNRTHCAVCRSELPARDDLLFCPSCGAPNAPAPCARCGTVLEESWHFCIRCGTARRR